MTLSAFDERTSGILLHPSSLPGPHGHGDLGPAAHDFVEFLAGAGQRWWQMLPVGLIGGGNSPYDSPSSCAGNPLLVSLELLVRDGLLTPGEILAPRRLATATRCLFKSSQRFKERRLRLAFERFSSRHDLQHELETFKHEARAWLPGFALYRALKRAHAQRSWIDWEQPLALREPAALARAHADHHAEIRFEEFVQFLFERQWRDLHQHCRAVGVRLLGDVPMFVAHDGADVWEHRNVFQLDEHGRRRVVAGVPPDYFSAEGQLWGNPLYDWAELERTGYAWWFQRLRTTLARFDALRIDHFIAFHRYWEIPAHSRTAREGRFVLVPGTDFFSKLRDAIGGLPFIAEDLGLVTPEVHALRTRFHMPGMKVLQFGFSGGPHDYQPHRYERETVVYTGTHDNDTTLGWLSAHERATSPEESARLEAERDFALRYAGSDGSEPHWDFLRVALASTANTALFPLQDVLGFGTQARMNVPGTAAGNWGWRFQHGDLTRAMQARLRQLSETFERIPNAHGHR